MKGFAVGDQVHYHVYKGKKRIVVREGRVVDSNDCLAVVDLGKYRETISRSDLISGQVKLISIVREGEDIMNKKPVPTKEVLQELFTAAGENITRAAQLYAPPVSRVTMGNWLRSAGIIKDTAVVTRPVAPAAAELRQVWDEKNTLKHVAGTFAVTIPTAKRWLKAAGVISETATGIQTKPLVDSDDEKERPLAGENFAARDDEPIQYSLTNDHDHDHEVVKKLVDFSLAKFEGRLDKLEASIASLAGIVLNMQKPAPSTDDPAEVIADLFIRVLARVIRGGAGC